MTPFPSPQELSSYGAAPVDLFEAFAFHTCSTICRLAFGDLVGTLGGMRGLGVTLGSRGTQVPLRGVSDVRCHWRGPRGLGVTQVSKEGGSEMLGGHLGSQISRHPFGDPATSRGTQMTTYLFRFRNLWGDPGVTLGDPRPYAPQMPPEAEVRSFTRCVVELLEVWGWASVRALDVLPPLRVSPTGPYRAYGISMGLGRGIGPCGVYSENGLYCPWGVTDAAGRSVGAEGG